MESTSKTNLKRTGIFSTPINILIKGNAGGNLPGTKYNTMIAKIQLIGLNKAVDLCYHIDGKEITVYTMLPFTWERTNGFCNIYFFNDYFLHKVNNAVIESLDRNFVNRMVREKLETINITNL